MPVMDFWRQIDIVSPEDLSQLPVTIIGAGGIGSPTALALAKMGVENITVYDDDRVELHNLPNQLYRFGDLGKTKVEGLSSICRDFAGVELKKVPERLNGHALSGIVVSGVDTMKARKEMWERIRWNPSIPLYIEARMGAEVCRIHSIKPTDPSLVKWYESTLYSDEEAVQAPCTARAIIYCSFMIGALVANQVKKFAKAEMILKEIIFDLATLTLIVN
jgi:hypothetical protein